MTSGSLNKALVATRYRLKKLWRKLYRLFCFRKIYGTRLSMQCLWYALPYYVGVEAQFLYLWGSEGILLPSFVQLPAGHDL
jgi:hypothetical protein